jgi:hypothetical protein
MSHTTLLLCACLLLSLFFTTSAQGLHLDTFRILGIQKRLIQPKPPKPPKPQSKPDSQTPRPSDSRSEAASPRNENTQHGEHLQDWIANHQNLTVDQRVQALHQEPGFDQLPAETQQRMIQRMRELSAMTPEQQQNRANNVETMEHLSPEQRQQVRGALLDLGSLPEDRQRLVRKAFRDLRQVPVEQRQAILDSDRFHSEFSDQERSVLSNLLIVEPYLSPQRSEDNPQSGDN